MAIKSREMLVDPLIEYIGPSFQSCLLLNVEQLIKYEDVVKSHLNMCL